MTVRRSRPAISRARNLRSRRRDGSWNRPCGDGARRCRVDSRAPCRGATTRRSRRLRGVARGCGRRWRARFEIRARAAAAREPAPSRRLARRQAPPAPPGAAPSRVGRGLVTARRRGLALGRSRPYCSALMVMRIILVLVAAVLSAASSALAGGPVPVVAAENAYGDITQQIGLLRLGDVDPLRPPGRPPSVRAGNPQCTCRREGAARDRERRRLRRVHGEARSCGTQQPPPRRRDRRRPRHPWHGGESASLVRRPEPCPDRRCHRFRPRRD